MLIDFEITIGDKNDPEVNINNMKIGPKGFVWGSTEENGYLFVIDPSTLEFVSWDEGRTELKLGNLSKRDITDFVVWKEKDHWIILVCQAYPAEIYRIRIPIERKELPNPSGLSRELVYSNPDWYRVMSIAVGTSSDGKKMIMAGSYGNAELIVSIDGGTSWEGIDYFSSNPQFTGYRIKDKLTRAASISEIDYVNNTWFVFMYHSFLLSDEYPWEAGYRHFVNGLMLSKDGGNTWELAKIPINSNLETSLYNSIRIDVENDYLPEEFYGLVGEVGQSLVEAKRGVLYISTGMDNYPKIPFGGRILKSLDGGSSWKETYHFIDFTDIVLEVDKNHLLAGTSSKRIDLNGDIATGEFWVSCDQGDSFYMQKILVSSAGNSTIRDGVIVVGVSSLVSVRQGVFIGTVDESESGKILFLQK